MDDQNARTLVKVAAWLNIFVGTVHTLLTVVALIVGALIWPRIESFMAELPEFETALHQLVALNVVLVALIVLLSVTEIGAAYFLFRHSERARKLSVGIGVCNLMHVPLGTAVGAFTLWTLTRPDVRRLFGHR